MQANILQPSRMGWIDAMRGFSMFVVVLGHVLLAMEIGGYRSFIGSIFLTFRMPLFFFVSGFFSYRNFDWWNKKRIGDILKRKLQAQVLCTLLFFSLFQLVRGGGISLCYGFGGYWFTIVLFQMYLCYLLLSILSKLLKLEIVIPALIILSVVCVGIIAFYRGDSWLWTFLCWENLTKYIQFFTLGIICSKYRESFFKLLSNNRFITIVTVGWVVCMLLWYDNGFKLNCPLAYSVVHDIIVRYFALLTVVSAFFGYSARLSSDMKWCSCLRFIGQRTLDIYMIHYFFMPDLTFLPDFLKQSNIFVVQLFTSSFITSLILGISLLVSMLLRRSRTLECWLFGVKPKTIG